MTSPGRRSRKIKQRTDQAVRLSRTIGIPEAQIITGDFAIRDVINHSEADQRATVRSGETKTVHRKPKLHKLVDAHVITRSQAEACQWYADRFSAGYDTVGITANYGGAGGGGDKAFTHLAKHLEQMIARQEYEAARRAIPGALLSMFERVVLHGRPMGKLANSFRLAISKLQEHMTDVGIAA